MTQPSISVQGTARIRKKPESLLMMGTVDASGATLEMALSDLSKRCEVASGWLKRLGAAEIEYGVARFPDQVEPTPMSFARRHQGLKKPAPTSGEKKVLAAYTAVFAIADKSPDEVLILADRLRFESESFEEEEVPEQPTFDAENLEQQMQAMMAKATREIAGDGADGAVQFLFRSRLSASEEEEASQAAIADARRQAKVLAAAAGIKIGAIQGVSRYGNETVQHSHASMLRMQSPNNLGETSFGSDKSQVLSESPRPSEFSISVHVTYSMEDSGL